MQMSIADDRRGAAADGLGAVDALPAADVEEATGRRARPAAGTAPSGSACRRRRAPRRPARSGCLALSVIASREGSRRSRRRSGPDQRGEVRGRSATRRVRPRARRRRRASARAPRGRRAARSRPSARRRRGPRRGSPSGRSPFCVGGDEDAAAPVEHHLRHRRLVVGDDRHPERGRLVQRQAEPLPARRRQADVAGGEAGAGARPRARPRASARFAGRRRRRRAASRRCGGPGR